MMKINDIVDIDIDRTNEDQWGSMTKLILMLTTPIEVKLILYDGDMKLIMYELIVTKKPISISIWLSMPMELMMAIMKLILR